MVYLYKNTIIYFVINKVALWSLKHLKLQTVQILSLCVL